MNRKKLILFFLTLWLFLFCPNRVLAQNQYDIIAEMNPNGHVSLALGPGFRQLKFKPYQKMFLGMESDRVQIKIFDNPGIYVNSAQLILDLSQLPEYQISDITFKSYAIHGIAYYNQSLQGNKIIYQASDINSTGIWTVEVNFPKGVLKPSLRQKILFWSANSSLIWFSISAALLVIVFGVMFSLIWKRHQIEKVHTTKIITNAPPSDLPSPALAILQEKHASYRAIAAGILYLAARGFVALVKKGDSFVVAKYREPNELSGIDRKFYDLIIGKWFARSIKEIQLAESHDLFNQAAGEIHKHLYQDLIDRGLFVKDPWLSIHKTRATGILAAIFSSIGFFISLAIMPYPPFAIIIWLTLILASLLIISIAPKMPLLSQAGVEERQKWLSFREYLKDPTPMSVLDIPLDLYLHFAVALSCEQQWILRYHHNLHRIPRWYIGPAQTIEDVAVDILAFVEELSRAINSTISPENK